MTALPVPARAHAAARAYGAVAAVLLALGVLAGALWPFLTPTAQLVQLEGGAGLLPGESARLFDAVAVFVCVFLVAGLVGGFAAWVAPRAREVRGPAALAAVLVGAAGGNAAGLLVAGAVAGWRFPDLPGAGLGEVFARTPEVPTWSAAMAMPLAACAAYLVAAVLSPWDALRPEVPAGVQEPG